MNRIVICTLFTEMFSALNEDDEYKYCFHFNVGNQSPTCKSGMFDWLPAFARFVVFHHGGKQVVINAERWLSFILLIVYLIKFLFYQCFSNLFPRNNTVIHHYYY